MHTDFVLDALERALYARQPSPGEALIHHSDRSSQYLLIRYSERLAEAGIEPSVGSRGVSYDNALTETINGLYKAEMIHRRALWKTSESVELATLEWVFGFNHHRLLEPVGYRSGSANPDIRLSEFSASMGDGNRLPKSRSNEKTPP